MRMHHLSALTAAAFLAACSDELAKQSPPGEPEDFLRAADVLVAAQCELDRAARRDPARFRFRKVDLSLTLTVQRTEAVGGGITLTIPIASTDVTLRRERTPSGAALRKMDFRTTYSVGQTRACPSEAMPTTPDGIRLIEGGLGLREWIGEMDALVAKSGSLPTEANYQMTFEIAVDNSLSPIFSRPVDDVDGSLSTRDLRAREVKHRIAVTIVPDGAAPAGALKEAADRFLARIDG